MITITVNMNMLEGVARDLAAEVSRSSKNEHLQGSGFRVQGLWFRVQGLGFRFKV